MKKLKQRIYWVAQQAVLGVLIWFGVVKGVEGAAKCALFLLWFINCTSLFAVTDDCVSELVRSGRSVPAAVEVAWDALVIGALVWNDWTWTAVGYLIAMLIISSAHSKADKLRGAAA